MSGTLYIVATPIGHLADMTFRAVDTLKAVDWIACEDTRQTRKLLDHYGIDKPLISYHEHNERERSPQLIERLENGSSGALVSDAGTPLVSDPGYRLVNAAIERGVALVPIPGASAVIAALSVSGLPTDSFRFGGFLPRKSGERRSLLASLSADPATLVFYEAPHRMPEALADIADLMQDPTVVCARELTKIHEEILRGKASEVREILASRPAIKGEFTLLIAPRDLHEEHAGSPPETVRMLEAQGYSRMDAIKEAARRHGLPKREVYRLVESSES